MTAIKGTVDENLTLSASKVYLLDGFVYVKAPAILTIEAGTVIKGDQNTNGTLIIEQGAKIMAEGTAAKPIVFTSIKPKGSRTVGNWGGVIILGNAPTNLGTGAKIEGGVNRSYGGTVANDNSGVFKYVRIEYAGIAFQPDNEINGLTLGGVGSGTTIDYVQVSFCGDDAFEFFGGTVNAKHLIAYKTVDDMFDTDNGYSGKLQFLVGVSAPMTADASGSNGFESDNNSDGDADTPLTSAVFSNVSLFGPKATATTNINANFRTGMHIRRNSNISVHNSVVAGWPTGILLDGAATQANFTNGTLKIRNTVVTGTGTPYTPLNVAGGSTAADFTTAFSNAAWANALVEDPATLNIASGFLQTPAVDFRPGAGSPVLTGASFAELTDEFFDKTVTYKGAFGTENWATGWTNFDPNQADY
jgi:hypothetical protein